MTTLLDISRHSAEALEIALRGQFITKRSDCEFYGQFTWKRRTGVFSRTRQACIVQRICHNNPNNPDELHQEISCMRALSHPHVIRIFNALNSVTHTYVIHEAGTFLHKILYTAPAFDIKTSVSCALQVAQGMAYLHSRKIYFGFRDFILNIRHILVTDIANGVPKTLKLGSFHLIPRDDFFTVTNDKSYDVWSFAVFIYVFTTRTKKYRPYPWEVVMCRVVDRKIPLTLLEAHSVFEPLLEMCCRNETHGQSTFVEICDFLLHLKRLSSEPSDYIETSETSPLLNKPAPAKTHRGCFQGCFGGNQKYIRF